MEYYALPTDPAPELPHSSSHRHNSPGPDRSRWCGALGQLQPRAFLCGLILGLIPFLLLYHVHLSIHSISPLSTYPETCGTSPQQATLLGCKFDVMSFAWLPARCFDSNLTAEFLNLRDWEWYEITGDPSVSVSQRSVDVAAVLTGTYDELLVTQEYHLYHCTYMWRKMHRAIQRGQPLDGYIGSMGHTEHCETVLVMSDTSFNERSTSIFLKYATCPFPGQHSDQADWYRVIDGIEVHGFSNTHHDS